MMNKQKHFVLVHGADHGAWCWHKVTAGLKAAGNRVTTVDLAASGINMKKFEEVRTFQEYTEPLMEVLASLPAEEKVILVGHSLGGVSLAVAADVFPHKIAVAVFLAAFMPDTTHPPSYVLDQFIARFPKGYHWLDTQISASACDPSNASRHLLFFGHEFMRLKLYQLCPPEDLELAKTLLRPGSMLAHDLSKASKFRNEGYGSVSRVYIVCKGDLAIPKEFQKWMIQNYGAHEVMEIEGADHMAMLSKPQQVCDSLSQIALQYA